MLKQLLQIMLKFTLSQLTILITFTSLIQTFDYYNSDSHYSAVGPYLLESSRLPQNLQCRKFYQDDQYLINFLGTAYTRQQYMLKMQNFSWYHNKKLQAWLTTASVVIELVIELIGFVTENQVIFVIDYLTSLLLPHFTLIIDTITWGSACIEECLMLQVFSLPAIGIIGFITFGILIFLVLTHMFFTAIQLKSKNVKLAYGFLWALFAAYVLIIDLVSFLSQGTDTLYLVGVKFLILGTLISMLYKIL